MNKPIINVVIDYETASDDVVKDIEDRLKPLSDIYDIIITTNNMKIEVYDIRKLELIEEKLDYIADEISKISGLKQEIANIKHVYGIK